MLGSKIQSSQLRRYFSDKIFDVFYQFATFNLKKRLPLVIAGGCGLNCDWNTNGRQRTLYRGLRTAVANDSGSAIGTAIDAQFHFTGNPKIDWNVYAGQLFIADPFDSARMTFTRRTTN